MQEPKWSLRGAYMESCNCDYLCPCIYTNPQEAATHDHCTAMMVFRIDDGHFSETKLDGLKFALVIRSGRVMADGCSRPNLTCASSPLVPAPPKHSRSSSASRSTWCCSTLTWASRKARCFSSR